MADEIIDGIIDPIIDEIEDTADEIDEISEQLAVAQIISDERHTEFLEKVDTCLNRLESLSTTQSTAENPLLTQILAELATTRGELANLKSSMDTLQTRPTPLNSPTPEPENPEEPEPDALIEEPARDELENSPEPKPRKNRFI
jgi:hypothetical protein